MGKDGVSYTVNQKQLRELALAIQRVRPNGLNIVKSNITRAGMFIEGRAKQLAPVDYGYLRSSIKRFTTLSGYGVKVGTNISYAVDVELGTAPHIIRPVNKKVLVFPKDPKKGKGGRQLPRKDLIFTREVKHPGSPPRPFLKPAFDEEEPRLFEALRRELSNVSKKTK